MVSFTSLSILVLSALAIVHASPLTVGVEKCTTVSTGNLKTTNGHDLHLVNDVLKFGSSLAVEFRRCTPNFGGYSGDTVEGHLYIPSTKKCLTLKGTGGPPFKFGQAACYYSDDSGQVSSSFIKKKDGSIFFVGDSTADGSIVYYGNKCKSGTFGVSSSATSGVAKFKCVDDGAIGLTL
ncbi:hypothetical protein DL93DRAFT_1119570 [Clavulina sp. PMI_390]|nr:hypothetical protein DL93DRAFT_1119570 [Clavulina sp. PMI_390]